MTSGSFAGVVAVGFEQVPLELTTMTAPSGQAVGYRGVIRRTMAGGMTVVEFSDVAVDLDVAQVFAQRKLRATLDALAGRYRAGELVPAGCVLWGAEGPRHHVVEALWSEADPHCPLAVARLWSALGLVVELSVDGHVVTGRPGTWPA